MPNIDINTSQNVTISYELAKLRERVMAWFIDFIILWFGSYLLAIAFAFAFKSQTGMYLYVYLVILPFSTFYTLLWESLGNGRTPGKRLLRLKVVRIDGRQPVFFDYLLRWVFRLTDIWLSVGSLAAILISSTERSQRMGDLLSNTVVVRSRSSWELNLKDILKIRTREEYEPRYPAVRSIREEDMLLIKQLLERNARFANRAHREAVFQAAERMAYLIGLPSVPDKKEEFLKDCIKDYIVLTR